MSEATERPEWKTDSAANVLRRFADAASRSLDGVLSDERLRIQASDLGAVVQAIDEVLRAVNTHEEAIGLLREADRRVPAAAIGSAIDQWRTKARALLSRLDGGTP